MGQELKDFESVNCAICQSSEKLNYSKKGQFGLPTNLVICKKCGFTYLSPRWNKERYNHFYTVEYDNYYRPEVKGSKYEYDNFAPIKAIVKRLEQLNLKPNQPQNILDIGCGMGDSLIYLKKEIYPNSNFHAIEPSSFCCDHLKKNGINVIANDVDTNWNIGNENKFDFIIMRHVLEHFLDPIPVLKKVSEILKPDGIVFIAVPNAYKPTKPLLSHYIRVVHVSYFSPVSLSNAFSLSNLNSLVMKEGDNFDNYEIYSIAKKQLSNGELNLDLNELGKQTKILNETKKLDFYYNSKSFIWKILKSLKLVR